MLFRSYRFFENKVQRDAEELVQETFLECVNSRNNFRRQSSFRTFLFAIARHTLYGHWRTGAARGKAIDFDDVSLAALSTSVGTRVARAQDCGRLAAALFELPMEQQLLLELFYWEELDGEQLAEVFDIAAATTRSRLFRARAALRERLANTPSPSGQSISDSNDLKMWFTSSAPRR